MPVPTITIDIGTTSVKMCLFGSDGALLTSSKHPTPTTTDGIGEIYDVPDLVTRVTQFIQALEPAQRHFVQRIVLTGVGESGGLVRPDLTLASPMILWHDHRGASYLDRLSADDRHLLYCVTGLPANGNYGISKTAWALDRYNGDATDVRWLNIAEYLAALMSGRRWSEPSLASRTMALDLRARAWSTTVCDLFGIDAAVFPELRTASEGTPTTSEFAADCGLDAGVTIHVAGHDHVVGGVGAGLATGELLNSTGTTEGLLYLLTEPRLDKQAEHTKLANGLACTGPNYTLFASIPTGGAAFATLQRLLGLDADRLNAAVAELHDRYLNDKIELGSVPLILPQFRGAPPPTKDHTARGVIAGISTDTTTDDIIFGCFLGMVAQFADVLDLFGVTATLVKIIGPASGNPLWLQTKADLLGTPLTASRFPEVVSHGAVTVAGGLANESGDAWEQTRPFDIVPDPARHDRLAEWRLRNSLRWEHLKDHPS